MGPKERWCYLLVCFYASVLLLLSLLPLLATNRTRLPWPPNIDQRQAVLQESSRLLMTDWDYGDIWFHGLNSLSSLGSSIMIPQVMTNETVTVISQDEVNFLQTDQPQPTPQRQDSLKKHLKTEVKVMAAIQIMCGVMVLSLGIILASAPTTPHLTSAFSVLLKSGYPFVGALCFVISGVLSVITEKKRTKPLVHSSLALSILSAFFALTGIIILSANLAALDPALQQCKLMRLPHPATVTFSYYLLHLESSDKTCFKAKATLTGALSLMLICSVLELGLAGLIAMLWWQQSHSDFSQNVIFLFQDSKNKSSVSSESLCNPAYEKVLTS